MAGKITVVGLGAGDMDQLTLGVYKQLKQAKEVYMRTQDHPLTAELMQEVPSLTFLMRYMKSMISLMQCMRKSQTFSSKRLRRKILCMQYQVTRLWRKRQCSFLFHNRRSAGLRCTWLVDKAFGCDV